MNRIDALCRQDTRRIIGLNSGTSMDAIDALLVDISGSGDGVALKPVQFLAFPFPDAVRRHLLAAPDFTCVEVCRLNRAVGELFAEAAAAVARAAGVELASVDVIASHGQTVCHLPASADGAASTLQIGDADVISARTGRPVISDFRTADVAAGGAGAPLMPWLDRVLLGAVPGTITLNLGGITALTWLPGGAGEIRAFDVGPCNTVLDLLARGITGGAASFDLDGALARRGRVDGAALLNLLRHPFLTADPPKTTGREEFAGAYVAAVKRLGLSELDLLATHTALVGASVRAAADRWIPGGVGAVRRVVASGGGVHNPALMDGLRSAMAPASVVSLGALGWDPDAKEALLFALLGNDRLFGIPSNLPGATGASRAVPLGRMTGF